MPAPKFEKDGTPHITVKDRLLHIFTQYSPEEIEAGVVLSAVRQRIEEEMQSKVAWSGFYKAYKKLLEEQQLGFLPEGVRIPLQQEVHSSTSRRSVVDLRAQGLSHAEIADELGISASTSRTVASKEGITQRHEVVTSELMDAFVRLWKTEGKNESQIQEDLGISEGRFNYLYRLAKKEEKISRRSQDIEYLNARNEVILAFAKQGYTPVETQTAMLETYGFDVSLDKIYGMLRDFRNSGQLPKFKSREEIRAWRENLRKKNRGEVVEAIALTSEHLANEIGTLLTEGGKIVFQTDRLGGEILNLQVFKDPHATEELRKQTKVKPAPLNYVRKEINGNVWGELVFDSKVAAFLYDEKKDSVNFNRSLHGKLFFRTLELMRTNIILEVASQLGDVWLPEEDIPSIESLIKAVAQKK